MQRPVLRDRQILLALLVAALVLLPRAALISAAHSETYDEEYHLSRGALFWSRSLATVPLNDPPLGEALAALPLVLTNRASGWTGGLYDHSLAPESALLLTHLWMSLLFLPAIGIGFAWAKRLWGLPSAWLVVALLLMEPTFAAHAPLAALDMIGTSGALVGSFLIWRLFESPSALRLAAAAAATALALMLKNTALGLGAVWCGTAALFWIVRPLLRREAWPRVAAWRSRLLAVGAALIIGAVTLWALTLFDVSEPRPRDDWGRETATVPALLQRPVPGGIYLTALLQGIEHAGQGHYAYLFGERRTTGWWYYFPAVLLYKMPIGVAVCLGAALFSLRWRRPCWEEWGLALPLLVWAWMAMAGSINIGLRHFLPAYAFLLLLAARSLAPPAPRAVPWLVWGGIALAATHAAAWHPDYLSYLNLPRRQAWTAISDSNLDWGQGLKQVRAWLERRAIPNERPVHLLYFGDDASDRRVRHYLGDRVTMANRPAPLPDRGLVIASPVWVAGPYDPLGRYAPLRRLVPIDVIGHSLLVYDLDK